MAPRDTKRLTLKVLTLLAVVASGLILVETANRSHQLAVDDIRAQSTFTLRLVIDNLRGELAKYSFQPRLLSSAPVLAQALKADAASEQISRANRELERIR